MKKYYGKYIITKSFTDTKVIASGKDIIKAYNRALKKGAENPVINYVFDPNIPHYFILPHVMKLVDVIVSKTIVSNDVSVRPRP